MLVFGFELASIPKFGEHIEWTSNIKDYEETYWHN